MQNNIHPNQISLFDSLQNRAITKSVGGGRLQRLHCAYEDIISVENLLISWREFLRGKRKRKDIAEFSLNFSNNIFLLHQELSERIYRHGGYQAFRINDPKPRDIHKASVRDRLVHHALYRILYPYFDRKFIYDSYSCRIEKGTHRAMNRFKTFARGVAKNNTQTCWVLKCDIKKFFANIDHSILKEILDRHIGDKDTLYLLGQVIDSFNTEDRIGVGLPLGNLTSQLLVNIYMNQFDHFVKRNLKVWCYVRYADDFVILNEDREYLKGLIPQISKFLMDELMLTFHPDKLCIKTFTSGVDFLGWVHFPYYRVLRSATKWKMFRNLERKQAKAVTYEESVASYLGMLSHGNAYGLSSKVMLLFKQ